jgi:hypothetical protein
MHCIRTDCKSGQPAIWMPCVILAKLDVLGGLRYRRKIGEARFPAPFCDDCARRSFVSDLVTDRVWLSLLATVKHQGQKEIPTRAETGIHWEPIEKALRIRDQAREAYEIRAEAPKPDRLIETV